MPIIQQLSRHVADLIAAGEVVERPASCVKELVENAVDAGAKNVTVEIQNGGMTLIRITDDGCGMEPQDAKTAFLRHATSKIREKDDLESIMTLGFRGEALAAIASVSRIDLLTKTKSAPSGTALHLEAGKLLSEQPAGCPDGTTILVRDLFYNTPARMKFMKTDVAEASAAFAAVQHQALAHPEVSFRFLKDGEEQLHTAGDGTLFGAVYSVLGRQLANEMTEVSSRWEKISVSGFVSKPAATRGNRARQQFFINGRFVRSALLSSALEEAYRNQLLPGRFPACVLHVTMPPQAVDVNVHPAKTEVRFLRERDVFDAVHYGVLSALGKAPAKPEMKLPEQKPQQAVQAAAKPKQDFFKTVSAAEFRRMAEPKQPSDTAAAVFASSVCIPKPEPKPSPEPPKPAPAPVQQSLPLPEPEYRIVGEALDTYIIVEQDDALLFIDKHAAHERILFEKLKKQSHPAMPQVLLSPQMAELTREEAAAVLENAALLSAVGYEAEDFGDGAVLLRQIPSDVSPEDACACLQELAQCLLDGKTVDPDALHDSLLHTIACKAAIKGGQHTDEAERVLLVRQVLSREDLKYCPHGRPICTVLTKRQLEKQFKR